MNTPQTLAPKCTHGHNILEHAFSRNGDRKRRVLPSTLLFHAFPRALARMPSSLTCIYVDGGSTFDCAQTPGMPRTVRINVGALSRIVDALYPDGVRVQKLVNCASHAHPTWLRNGFTMVDAEFAAPTLPATGVVFNAVIVSGSARMLATAERLLADGWNVTFLLFARAKCAAQALATTGLDVHLLDHYGVTFDMRKTAAKHVSPLPGVRSPPAPAVVRPYSSGGSSYEQFLIGSSLLAAL